MPTLWWVSQSPVALAGMAAPPPSLSFDHLADRGLETVVNLTGTTVTSADEGGTARPVERLIFDLEDLWRRPAPSDPEHELEQVAAAVTAVLERYRSGRGVVVHCEGGRGRTGTVLGAALVQLGLPSTGVAAWLHEVHEATGGWPECPWQRTALDALG